MQIIKINQSAEYAKKNQLISYNNNDEINLSVMSANNEILSTSMQ